MITGDWSLGYTSVSGAEDICIGGQRLRVIFAPVFLIFFYYTNINDSFLFVGSLSNIWCKPLQTCMFLLMGDASHGPAGSNEPPDLARKNIYNIFILF